jgi:nitrogen PTS system EIIA component
MTLFDYLSEARILIGLQAKTRRDYIHALAAVIAAEAGCSVEAITDPLLAREKLGSTAIGKGVSLPHSRSAGVAAPIAAAAILAAPLSADAPDDVDVDLVIAFVLPAEGGELFILSRVVKDLRDEQLLNVLRGAPTSAAFLDILRTSLPGPC